MVVLWCSRTIVVKHTRCIGWQCASTSNLLRREWNRERQGHIRCKMLSFFKQKSSAEVCWWCYFFFLWCWTPLLEVRMLTVSFFVFSQPAVPKGSLQSVQIQPRVTLHHGVLASTSLLAFDATQRILAMASRWGTGTLANINESKLMAERGKTRAAQLTPRGYRVSLRFCCIHICTTMVAL